MDTALPPVITRLTAAELLGSAEELADVLVDTVDNGASVGFLAPLDPGSALRWWEGLAPEVADGRLALWTARTGGRITGTVQFRPGCLPNGRHRAEIAKLMVHRDARGRGIGRALLATVEEHAVRTGASLLILDTQTGSTAERMYRAAGWTEAGTVPDYAADPVGALRPTTFFYKRV